MTSNKFVGDYHVDTGCRVHPKCLTCPLPACVYDTPHTLAHRKIRRRDEAVALRTAGLTTIDIARKMETSRGRVDTWLREAKALAAETAEVTP